MCGGRIQDRGAERSRLRHLEGTGQLPDEDLVVDGLDQLFDEVLSSHQVATLRKWSAHERWIEALREDRFQKLLESNDFAGIAQRAVAIESRTNLLFSFEKMALRDAVKSEAGAKAFANGLWDLLHGKAPLSQRFEGWVSVLAGLPRRQTRVLTWPLATVFGFIAQPRIHFFVKPMVTRRAARNYGYDLGYQSKPDWPTYSGILRFARAVLTDIQDLRPRDIIDLQSFIWVQGSDEYPD
jgi:hypothetical protein